mmetsp:Transcript_15095/g.38347  ORF Transcript_15095/g.38347 Transcript_15095/m.38347 type:complete len:205 (-) Transcript_15095:2290-2904(-)
MLKQHVEEDELCLAAHHRCADDQLQSSAADGTAQGPGDHHAQNLLIARVLINQVSHPACTLNGHDDRATLARYGCSCCCCSGGSCRRVVLGVCQQCCAAAGLEGLLRAHLHHPLVLPVRTPRLRGPAGEVLRSPPPLGVEELGADVDLEERHLGVHHSDLRRHGGGGVDVVARHDQAAQVGAHQLLHRLRRVRLQRRVQHHQAE